MDTVDAFSTVQKQIRMLDLILHFHQRAQRIVKRGAPICGDPQPAGGRHDLIRMKSVRSRMMTWTSWMRSSKVIDEQMDKLETEYR